MSTEPDPRLPRRYRLTFTDHSGKDEIFVVNSEAEVLIAGFNRDWTKIKSVVIEPVDDKDEKRQVEST